MSSVAYLREFVNERLTAAAEEIFRVFEKIIIEYEEEIDRQRKLLDIVLKPEIKLHRTELPQQHVCKEEEVLSAQQLCIQERNSSLDQEDPEPPQIKEEQEELCISQEGEQLEVKQETETFMLIPTDEEGDHSEDQTLDFNPEKSQSVTETELPASLCISWLKDKSDCDNPEVSEPKSVLCLKHDLIQNPTEKSIIITSINNSVEPEPNQEEPEPPQIKEEQEELGISQEGEQLEVKQEIETFMWTTTDEETDHSDDWTLDLNSDDTVNADQTEDKQRDSGSICNAEPNLKKRHCKSNSLTKNKYHCDTCEKDFNNKSFWERHMRTHTGEKPFPCNQCGRRFSRTSTLNTHKRIHTGEKPFSCTVCGRIFGQVSTLNAHKITHTGEKSHSCTTCGKTYCRKSVLMDHIIRVHTGEMPHSCNTCGRHFTRKKNLRDHMRIHTGEMPLSCGTCGKRFRYSSSLKVHLSVHTDEKP